MWDNPGWIDLAFPFGVAIIFIAWQYISVSRTLNRTRAERREREAREAASGASEAEPSGAATEARGASDKAA